ncbi:MAG: hypothetical protein ACRDQZ_08645 [Mycobacteriales bacterium]
MINAGVALDGRAAEHVQRPMANGHLGIDAQGTDEQSVLAPVPRLAREFSAFDDPTRATASRFQQLLLDTVCQRRESEASDQCVQQSAQLPYRGEWHPHRHRSVARRPPNPGILSLIVDVDGAQYARDPAVQALQQENHGVARRKVIEQQDTGTLIRGDPQQRACGAARDLRRLNRGVGALERTGNIIERGRDARIRARNSRGEETGMEFLEQRRLAATAGAEETQMLAA